MYLHLIYLFICINKGKIEILIRWSVLVSEEEAKGCITASQPFKDATNSYAVRNLLLDMHRQRRIRLCDPPENKQMRFGFYKAALLFIGTHSSIME